MKSSSIPPAVETTTSTIECSTRYRIVSRVPDEIRFEVYPKKILHLVFFRTSGSLRSGSCSKR
jgi:hypothetical protein